MINIGDLVELIVDIPERNLRSGTQGTVVHCHDSEAYEIEFTNDDGETVDFLSLSPKQFIVVWRAETEKWVSKVEQVSALAANLADESVNEILNFARFLSVQDKRKATTGGYKS